MTIRSWSLARRVAVQQPRGQREVVRDAVRGGAQPLVEVRLLVIVELPHPAGRLPGERRGRRNDRHERQPRSEVLGQRDGVRQRQLGLGRAVKGDKDVPVAQHAPHTRIRGSLGVHGLAHTCPFR
jgi:hypothetical protein